jgi:hypothetical protein
MKLLLLLATLICFQTKTVKAQPLKTPTWMNGKGYWVIQSNLKTPKNSTIFFYTNKHELVYKETITGQRINPDRVKIRKHLEAVLKQAIVAWEKEGIARENEQMVVTARK